jgi:hypothetical protein
VADYLTTTPATQVIITTVAPGQLRRLANRLRRPRCDVYWGSHGCERPRGHRGQHKCGKGCPPFYAEYAFGDDWHG